MKVKAEQNR